MKSLLKFVWLAIFFQCSFIAIVTAKKSKKQKNVDDSIRTVFRRIFDERCSKYAFVQKYQQMLENPPKRFLVFLYHDRDLRNGGFGDRLGGLLTAFVHSIRFNRIMLIKAANGFYDYFRPFHANDIADHGDDGKYLWQHWRNWTYYNVWKQENPQYTDKNKATWEYDMTNCVSNTEAGFAASQTSYCAMDSGDVSPPVIRFASNRAYFCHYENRTEFISHSQVKEALQINEVDDLFEVAGCISRLVMWPTNKLWSEIDELYAMHLNATLPKDSNEDAKDVEIDPQSAEVKPKKKSKKSKKLKKAQNLLQNYTLQNQPYFQIGLHFRCGDIWSYKGLKLQNDQHDPLGCIVHKEDIDVGIGFNPNKSYYMRGGNPMSIGECAKMLVQHGKAVSEEDLKQRKIQIDENGFFTYNSTYRGDNTKKLVFITSDNVEAAEQMRSYVDHDNAIVTPQGCHIELDPSTSCYKFTTKYWFMLALSDLLITQTFGEKDAPTSSFSRYAGIYGLKPDSPFRSGKYCGDVVHSTKVISRIAQGNWFCE